MHRCLSLARNGLGYVQPNPLVGCVILHDEKIIGEGWHRNFGGPHAEVEAVESVKDKGLIPHSTLYVNLEPCCHHGKTPPCTGLIISNKIPMVVIAVRDPFPEVNGKGIQQLTNAGVNVIYGILEKEARFFNRRFFTFHEKKRPYVILKWAQSKDGFIGKKSVNAGTQERRSTPWISGELSRTLVHKWRSEEQAIMVGTNTAMNDDPQLTVRLWKGKNPLRVIIDRELKLPAALHLFDKKVSTLIFNQVKNDVAGNIEYYRLDFSQKPIESMLAILCEKQMQSVIVEGGAKLLASFIESGLWDEARVFTSAKTFLKGIKAPALSYDPTEKLMVHHDELAIYYRNRFHAPE